jgi:ABC-2 type transport system ATP-binding protein
VAPDAEASAATAGAAAGGNGQGPPMAITVAALTKNYGEIEAVRGIDFEVPTGETFGFLGPNGAGKSTTIKILCTLARPTSGTARVAGHDVTTERDAVRRNIGLVFQDTTLDNYLTGAQNLRFHAELYGVPTAAVAPRMQQVMEMVGLWDSAGWRSLAACCTRPGCCSWTSPPSGSTRRRAPRSGSTSTS